MYLILHFKMPCDQSFISLLVILNLIIILLLKNHKLSKNNYIYKKLSLNIDL